MKFVAPSWESIYSLSIDLAERVRREGAAHGYDALVGVSRGGLVITRILSDLLSIQDVMITRCEYYTDLGKREKKPRITQEIREEDIEGKNVLLVDDVADTGESLEEIKRYLGGLKPKSLVTATLYVKPWSKVVPEHYVAKTDAWIIFPWERYEAMKSIASKDGGGSRLLSQTKIPRRIIERLKEYDRVTGK